MASLRNFARHIGLLFLGSTIVSAAVRYDVCADFNTADTDPQKSIYQTNGLCFNTCKENYAYAITQYQSCWCSNYAPDDDTQVDRSRCNTPCPAYPDEEQCGGDGTFAYILLANAPSGTRGPSSPSSTKATTKSTKEAKTTTATARVTETVQTTVTEVSTSARPIPTSSTSQESSSSAEQTSSEPPAVLTTSYVLTVTAGSIIKTVTVAPAQTMTESGAPAASEDNANSSTSKNDGGLNTGQVVGIVIGVVGGILLLAAAGVFWFLRRKKQSKEAGYQEDPSVRGTSPGTIGTAGGAEMMMGGAPVSATNTTGNRSSILQIDPRMDPFRGQGLYPRTGSHESLNTLRDDHDYSRRIQQPLRATNPDPDVD
ncbi:hypothetical protein HJFPF1_09318 [Paramyrothecium foliicola]|nr:hypothetical protein HJFPF1_09318 [Paramyrothecium foliicola]